MPKVPSWREMPFANAAQVYHARRSRAERTILQGRVKRPPKPLRFNVLAGEAGMK